MISCENDQRFKGHVFNELRVSFGPSLSKKNCVLYFIESPLKMMKNVFYFIVKALSFSKYLTFYHDFLVM